MSSTTVDHARFDHAHLKRVIPVAETRVFDDITVTVMSLELYQDGFIINLLEGGPVGSDQYETSLLIGAPVLYVADEHGREYTIRMAAGFGGSGLGGDQPALCNTFVMQATPELPSDAGRLTFEMLLVRQFDPDGGYQEHNVVAGPWTFDIVIPPDPSEGLEWPDPDAHMPVPTIDGKLRRIVPVARRSGGEEASITIYSLELFDRGFVTIAQVDWVNEGWGMPRMRWSGRDDLGGEYRKVNDAGGGGLGRSLPEGRHSWRMSFWFKPAVDPDASTLTLEVPRLELISYNFDESSNEPGKPDITVEGVHEGPWTFTVDLTG